MSRLIEEKDRLLRRQLEIQRLEKLEEPAC